MKNIKPKIIRLLSEGYCAPQIARLAHATMEPAATIHYNIRKLEEEGMIKTYKAVFDYQKIEEGFCAYVLLGLTPLSPSELRADHDRIGDSIAKNEEVESVDVVAGDWSFIVKVRTRNQEEYYNFLKKLLEKEKSIKRSCSMISLKQAKTEFILTSAKLQKHAQ